MGINSYSKTPGSNNATPPNGWPEGMAPSDVNNSARQNMADLRSWYENPQWIDLGGTLTYVTTNQFRVVNAEVGGDLTGVYEIGRLIKVTDGSSAVVYGVITASSYSAPNTTVTVAPFSGSFTSISKAELSAQTRTGAGFGAIPVRQNAQTGTSYTFLTDDWGKLVTFSNASPVAVTLPQANSSTFQAGWAVYVNNLGAGLVTITPTTSTIDGAATLEVPSGHGAAIISNGTNYIVAFRGNQPVASQAEAEAGTNTAKFMTPLRVAQAIAALAQGKIQDFKHTNFTTLTQVSSSTWGDVTDATVSITPKSSSNVIYVFLLAAGRVVSGGGAASLMGARILRGASTVIASRSRALSTQGTASNDGTIGMVGYDAPATTSSTTYKVQINNTNVAGDSFMSTLNTDNDCMIIAVEVKP